MNDCRVSPPDFLVIEGPIGVGKTSLVKRIATSFSATTLLEAAEENPFLERFYEDGHHAAFPTQLHFLFQRSRQLAGLRQNDLFRQSLVADFMLEKDALFARLNLDDDEFDLYQQVYDKLVMEAPTPDLVVYLQASPDVLMQRIQKRARPCERTLDESYLIKVCDAYTEYFHRYDQGPCLIVNASAINPIDVQEDYDCLLNHICTHTTGKDYIDPTPFF